ncbi:hypothetical protein K439DRAFT_338023 [Ramaria rubella]|nr:hypothetical protein K439DRAFT_338023 [Ramaria rubella]
MQTSSGFPSKLNFALTIQWSDPESDEIAAKGVYVSNPTRIHTESYVYIIQIFQIYPSGTPTSSDPTCNADTYVQNLENIIRVHTRTCKRCISLIPHMKLKRVNAPDVGHRIHPARGRMGIPASPKRDILSIRLHKTTRIYNPRDTSVGEQIRQTHGKRQTQQQ